MMAFKAVVFLLYFPFFLEKQRIYKYNQSFSDYDKNWTVYDLGVNKSNKFGILMDK